MIGTESQEHETRVLNKEDVGGSPFFEIPPGAPTSYQKAPPDGTCRQFSFLPQSFSSQVGISCLGQLEEIINILYTCVLGKEQANLVVYPSLPTF